MQTFKKKDIKNFKPKSKVKPSVKMGVDDDMEEIDELVNSAGGSISGDEKNVNNSEIETAPQATSDDYENHAIQPNRYLYNTGSYSAKNVSDSRYIIAKNKAITLLEELGVDSNENSIIDTKELPDSVVRKMLDLIRSVELNGIMNNREKIDLIINYINTKLNPNG